MMNEAEIRKYLDVIKRAVTLIENQLSETVETKPEPKHVVQKPVVEEKQDLTQSDFEKARNKHINDLIAIDCWPEAVPSFLVGREPTDSDQINRANAVLDMMIDRSLEGASFLDFGCGDGWMAEEVIQRGVKESIGYDVIKSPIWDKFQKAQFTTQYHKLKPQYYDVVLLYDVLDHSSNPVEVLNQARGCLNSSGTMYVRCHPWTSKHAMHLFKQGNNKAYWHLFLTYNEIVRRISGSPIFTRVSKKPLLEYQNWFKDFEIRKERQVKEPVSEFFHVHAFKELLASEQQIPMSEIDEFLTLMEIQYVDYTLVRKK